MRWKVVDPFPNVRRAEGIIGCSTPAGQIIGRPYARLGAKNSNLHIEGPSSLKSRLFGTIQTLGWLRRIETCAASATRIASRPILNASSLNSQLSKRKSVHSIPTVE